MVGDPGGAHPPSIDRLSATAAAQLFDRKRRPAHGLSVRPCDRIGVPVRDLAPNALHRVKVRGPSNASAAGRGRPGGRPHPLRTPSASRRVAGHRSPIGRGTRGTQVTAVGVWLLGMARARRRRQGWDPRVRRRRLEVTAGRVRPEHRQAPLLQAAPAGACPNPCGQLWSRSLRFWNPGGSYFDARRPRVRAASIKAKSRSAMS
jgi:hypothetical protein